MDNFTDTLLKVVKYEIVEDPSEINKAIRNQFDEIMNEKIDYIKLIGYERPKPYPKNNWLRMHGQSTIGRKLRRKRKNEIRRYFEEVMFKTIEEITDDILSFKNETEFNNFVDCKDLAIGDENTYYMED